MRLYILRLILVYVAILFAITANSAEETLEENVNRSFGSDPYQQVVTAFLDGTVPKIVGGRRAELGQLPWQVSLGVSWIASPAAAHFCGGSIYNERWIVTAAHCVVGNTPQSIIVTYGVVNLETAYKRVNVRRILVKDNYVSPVAGADVALIELKNPMKLDGSTSRAIGLLAAGHEQDELAVGKVATTSGFGITDQDGERSSSLLFVEVPIVDKRVCNAPLSYDGWVRDDMICAGFSEGGKDSCKGDSGGPLTVHAETGTPKLAGIVSWGDGCARPLRFGVYTRVTSYADWIVSCIGGRDDCTVK